MVTGAAGLLGRAVRRELERMGRPVLAIDRAPNPAAPVVAGDVTDIHRLHALVVAHPVGAIIHCAAFSGPMVARDNPGAMVAVNIDGTANVLEVARIHGVPRVVYCSSASVYGDTGPGPILETAPLAPTSLYGASKAASEHLVNSYARQYGVSGVNLRFSWIYGPGRTTDCVIRTMIEDAMSGRTTRMAFGADFFRQFVHVDDAAHALVLALAGRDLAAETYNVTGGSYLTLGDVGSLVAKLLPQADMELQPGRDPLDDVQGRFSIAAAASGLGFVPSVDLESGISRYIDWLRSTTGVPHN
jgi:nucleoside-diphosphate-sugar epimerase